MAKKDKAKAEEAREDAKPSEAKASEVKASAKASDESSESFSVSSFLQGTKEELDKVVWPSRQQLISESLAVILMVTLSATIISLVDKLFSWAAGQVF